MYKCFGLSQYHWEVGLPNVTFDRGKGKILHFINHMQLIYFLIDLKLGILLRNEAQAQAALNDMPDQKAC